MLKRVPEELGVDTLKFEELGVPERTLLLRAFNYDVDEEGLIIDENGDFLTSTDNPTKKLKVEEVMIVQGSLKVSDGTPTAISRFIRERVEQTGRY